MCRGQRRPGCSNTMEHVAAALEHGVMWCDVCRMKRHSVHSHRRHLESDTPGFKRARLDSA
eukprot:2608714-Lingulodinium_polyedra.AAC.1